MAQMDAQSFQQLANVLGTHAAGEVLLLAVARACGENASLWNKARLVGIPWQRKTWTALSTLQNQYNGGVETGVWEDNAEGGETLVAEHGASAVER